MILYLVINLIYLNIFLFTRFSLLAIIFVLDCISLIIFSLLDIIFVLNCASSVIFVLGCISSIIFVLNCASSVIFVLFWYNFSYIFSNISSFDIYSNVDLSISNVWPAILIIFLMYSILQLKCYLFEFNLYLDNILWISDYNKTSSLDLYSYKIFISSTWAVCNSFFRLSIVFLVLPHLIIFALSVLNIYFEPTFLASSYFIYLIFDIWSSFSFIILSFSSNVLSLFLIIYFCLLLFLNFVLIFLNFFLIFFYV